MVKNSHMENRRLKMTEKLWLYYFNDTLCAQGLITQEERQRMKRKIDLQYEPFLKPTVQPNLYSSLSKAPMVEYRT